jgi:hypothetical protein
VVGCLPGRGNALVEDVKRMTADSAVESEVKSMMIRWSGSTSESLRGKYERSEDMVS